MIANRQLGMDDYLAILRRRWWLVVLPAVVAPLAAFLLSFAFAPKYTSNSLLFVETQLIAPSYVKPLSEETTSDRMITLEQDVLSRDHLEPLVKRLGMARNGKSEDAVVEEIRNNVKVAPADPSALPASGSSGSSELSSLKAKRPERNPQGFIVSFTGDQPRDAQQVCSEVTSALLQEDFELSEQVSQSTADLLARQLDEVKHNLEDSDSKLASFKKHHMGQLPSDAENNARILSGLNSRLEASQQTLRRTQEEKLFTESLLEQEESAWKSSQSAPELPSLQRQLIALQDRLLTLQARYTQNHPEIARVQSDIAELKEQLNQAAVGNGQSPAVTPASAQHEPAHLIQLRQQIQRMTDLESAATSEQTQVTDEIDKYQKEMTVSPDVEEEYKQLTRDYETATRLYDDLLEKKSDLEMQSEMQRRQEGKQMRLLYPASLPESPSFPVRWKFAAVGLALGLVAGCGTALFIEMQDQSLRNEGDVLAGLNQQMLGSVSWVMPAKKPRTRLDELKSRLKPLIRRRTAKRT